MFSKLKSSKNKAIEYLKFNIIGVSNFLISQFIYVLLFLYFNMHYLLAYSIVSFFSILASYFFNTRFTFKENTYCPKKFSLSALIYLFEFFLNTGVIVILVNIFNISKIISPLIAPFFSTPPVFFMMRSVIKNKSVSKCKKENRF